MRSCTKYIGGTMGLDFKTEIDIILSCVVFITLTTLSRVIIDLFSSRRMQNDFKLKYLEEVKNHGETSVKLIYCLGALKKRMIDENSLAYRQTYQDYVEGVLDLESVQEKYFIIYQTFSDECQKSELDDLQKVIDELYANALSTLPKQ